MDFTELTERYLQSGVCCAETLVRVGLALRGEENESLANAAAGLCNGMFAGFNCGALTGGCLLLSYMNRSAARQMNAELAEWFDETYGMEYGSVNCEDIKENNQRNLVERCRPLILATAEKCAELLDEHGITA